MRFPLPVGNSRPYVAASLSGWCGGAWHIVRTEDNELVATGEIWRAARGANEMSSIRERLEQPEP